MSGGSTVRVENAVTSGTFSLDGETHQVDNNVWVVGDDDECVVAPQLRVETRAPIFLHPDDRPVWLLTHPGELWDVDLSDGQVIEVAGIALQAMHTPGHAPGAVCFYAEELGVLFTGDTLFNGGPGATGRSFSDYDTIVASIRSRLFVLPEETVVHTGHGDDTTIGAEKVGLVGTDSP